MSLRLVTPPASEPVTLAEAKLHLKVETAVTDDDSLITGLIKAAREAGELFQGRSWITQTWELNLDEFPVCEDGDAPFESQGGGDGIIELPRPRIIAVASVKYIDTAGVEQTLDPALYQVDVVAEPGRLAPAYGKVWPATKPGTFNAVKVQYSAGYGAAAVVPQQSKQGMLFLIGHLYENREAVNVGNLVTELPMGVETLWWGDRVKTFV